MKANRVLKVPMGSPEDTRGVLEELFSLGLNLQSVRAIMCMTEGDGFARGYAALAFASLFREGLGWPIAEVGTRVPLIMIGGCSGLVAPYAAVFVDDPSFSWREQPGTPGLAIGVTTTRPLRFEDIGTEAMIDAVAEGVRRAMADAAIDGPANVHNVQVKTPWPASTGTTGGRLDGLDAVAIGALARGTAALGVALALGEVPDEAVTAEAILRDRSIYSEVASVSAGTERSDAAILVLGNSLRSSSPYRIGHGVMKDGVDAVGVYAALHSLGVDANEALEPGEDNPIEHVFLKSGVDGTDACRGRRHVLRTDYLGAFSWLLGKAVIHATVSSIVGDPMMQVSGGAEHQGPPGGGTMAMIVR